MLRETAREGKGWGQERGHKVFGKVGGQSSVQGVACALDPGAL